MLRGHQQIWHNSAKGYLLSWRDSGTFLGDIGWGSYSTSARDTLGKVRGSERGIGGEWGEGGCCLPLPQSIVVPPLSSCGSNFNSTSVFINLWLASQGDRIQTLTRISPPDWLDTATPRGQKKETHFFSPPSFPPPSLLLASYLRCLCPLHHLSFHFLSSPPPLPSLCSNHLSLHPSSTSSCFFFFSPPALSVSCLSDIPPPPSAWWTGAAGFWRSNLLTKTGRHQKRDRQRRSQVIALREGWREREKCVLRDQGREEGIPFLFITTADRRTTDSFPFLFFS